LGFDLLSKVTCGRYTFEQPGRSDGGSYMEDPAHQKEAIEVAKVTVDVAPVAAHMSS
jgi:hypothetical protein